MDSANQRFFRPSADLAGVYGSAVLTLPQEQQFGLWLNLNRTITRQSLATTLGVGVLFATPEKGYLEQFMSSEEAELTLSKINLIRQHTESLKEGEW